jgi:hypothetical protein
MKTSLLARIIPFFAIALLASCSPNSPKATEISSPIIEVISFPMAIKIDDINLEFSGYRRVSNILAIEICFAPPSQERWLLDNVVLEIDNQEIPYTSLFSDTKTGRADGFSCGIVSYPIDRIPDSGKAEWSIGQLRTVVFSSNAQRDCDKAQKKLDEAKTGILITCDSSGFEIFEKPQTMSDNEAYDLIQDAFSNTIQVNWRFSFLFDKP